MLNFADGLRSIGTPPLRTGEAGWWMRLGFSGIVLASMLIATSAGTIAQDRRPVLPPRQITAVDHALDDGTQIQVTVLLSPQEASPLDRSTLSRIASYSIQRAGEVNGVYEEVARVAANAQAVARGEIEVIVEKCVTGEEYWLRAAAIGEDGTWSPFVATASPVRPEREWLDGRRLWMGVLTLSVCGSVILFVLAARLGLPITIRPIAGLEAITEAVGRSTEMGRPALFIAGIQDMNDMQTIAGLTILSRVSQKNAEYDTPLEVPTSRSLVMTAARENVATSYLIAGRPDSYNPDRIYYVSDEQFAFVSYVTGYMVREKPAACFYFGAFYAESLILAETGNSIGAIQVAGTAEPHQLPFLVAGCDYTLIGEEFFAASAYLSGDPVQLGSLKGQDIGKLIVVALILIGSALLTLGHGFDDAALTGAGVYLRDVMLSSG